LTRGPLFFKSKEALYFLSCLLERKTTNQPQHQIK